MILERKGFETQVLDIDSVSSKMNFLLKIRPLAAWIVGRELNKRSRNEDIVLCNNFFCWNARRGNSMAIYHMTEKGRAIATEHKMPKLRNLCVRTLNSHLDKKTGVGRKVIAVSDAVRDEIEGYYGLRVDRVIQNAVDLSTFKPCADKSALRIELGLPEESFLILYVGPNDKKKGIDFLKSDLLPRIRAGQHMVFVTDMKNESRRSTVVGRVGFDRIHMYFQACDAFVMPSHYEGWGIVLAEALACGLPAITSPAGIGNDLRSDSVLREYVVDGMDASRYSKLLADLQDSPERWRMVSSACREFAEKRYNLRQFEDSYIDLIDDMLKSAARAG
jgi:glycosyltransferase involved in cell wall biosynthesis